MLNQTENTKFFLNDMRKLARKPDSLQNQTKYQGRNVPTSIEKLYIGDTSKFEPTYENRQHLLNTMIPMIYSIARRISGKFGSRIELDDCINSGMIGAAIATDRYIEKSKIEPQTAKLSSYAYAYIEKYINEHCRSTNSLVSCGTTQWIDASSHFVSSGNELYGDGDGKQVEFFDIAPSENLRTSMDVEFDERQAQAAKYVNQLFSRLSQTEQKIVLMRFGISTQQAMSFKEIAKKLDAKTSTVESKFDEILAKLRTVFTSKSEIYEVINVLSKVNINSIQLEQLDIV